MQEERPTALETALEHLAIRRPDRSFEVRWFDTVESTMDIVAAAATDGEPAGLVAIADHQTAGRGRRGHSWSSPSAAGLYFSYLARPTRHLELVTLAAGVAVREGLSSSTGLLAQLKWPNDVLVGRRKLAGLLAEAAHVSTPDVSVVIGIGINLQPAAYPPDVALRATNLRTETGRDVSRFEVFTAVLERLADALAALEAGQAGDILRRWRDGSPLAVGTRVEWSKDGKDVSGLTAGIDESGALLVETAAGVERIIAGELQWQLPDS